MKDSTYRQLFEYIKEMQHVAVAFSGGVDSTLLTFIAHQALGKNMVAITIKTPYIPAWEIEEALFFTRTHDINHKIIAMDIPADISRNPPDRCYLCKKELFRTLQRYVKKIGPHRIIEGSNKDDLTDYRPGMRAVKELHISSPLLQMGITKDTIRALSRELNLNTWDKPAYACLLSRIPYHTKITAKELDRIAKAELVLRAMKVTGSRVRSHGDIARIEIPPACFDNFAELMQSDIRSQLVEKIQACGYLYVTLDLAGYQTGSLNKTLTVDDHDE
jgi:pyridinium-3,5-biscarboxylic acid mononucleotide sulfurtransferase